MAPRQRAAARAAAAAAAGALLASLPHATRAFPDGAGSCLISRIHGTQSWSASSLMLHFPAGGYDSSDASARVNVTLHCADAACASGAANNGFLLLAYDSTGSPAGRFTQLPSGAKHASACGQHAATHAAPGDAASWRFVWDPAGAGGPITFHAAVAVGYQTSFLQHGCLADARDAAGGAMVTQGSNEHAAHGRRRLAGVAAGAGGQRSARRRAGRAALAVAADVAPLGTVFAACPAAGAAHASTAASMGMGGSGGMRSSVWRAGGAELGGAPVLFQGAVLDTPGRLVGAVFSAFAFAVATSAAAAWAASAEAGAFAPAQPAHASVAPQRRWARARGAAAVVLRTGTHYGCMLVSMTYNVWLLLALMAGHGAAYGAAAVLARRRARLGAAERQ